MLCLSSAMWFRYIVPLSAWFLVLGLSVNGAELVRYPGPLQPVDDSFFGMHIHRAAAGTAWPAVAFAEWRLWDSGVSWPELEPVRDQWNFSLLDSYVRMSAENHVEILLTLGLTPDWASARPDEHSPYADGNAAEPKRLSDWENYVRTVGTRYKGRIHYYEIWNEPNGRGMFTGSSSALLQLSRTAYGTLKSIDNSNVVVSPSATMQGGTNWLKMFVASGGCQYVDVIGYHFYVTPDAPESAVSLIQKVSKIISGGTCAGKPLWNTESGWTTPKNFSSEQEAAGYLMRTYLLHWLLGVRRCYWYAWDNHNWSTLDLTSRSGNQMTDAGKAYGIIQRWMTGAILHSCARDSSGLWNCWLEREKVSYFVVWSENGTQTYHVPAAISIKQVSNWHGDKIAATGKLVAGPAPLLLTESSGSTR